MTTPQTLAPIIGTTIVLYVALMIVIAGRSRRRIASVEDYVVAGRRLPFWLVMPTLLATWFGAGTMLAVSDEVRARGLGAAALDPIGAGVCLILAGLLIAAPLWRMRLLTVPDFFARRFGRPAEILASVLMVPAYFGWIAAQYVALAGILQLFFGIDMVWGTALVAAFGALYTLMGGMWAVTLTDAVQLSLVVVGLVVMLVVVLMGLGDGSVSDGWSELFASTPAERQRLIPTESLGELAGWIGLFCAGALGNLPGQDLGQRIFAARSAGVARAACVVAGLLYLSLGAIPVLLALAADLLIPGAHEQATLPLLATAFLTPPLAVLFVVTVISVVLSTIDSAILSPATVVAQNLLRPTVGDRVDLLRLNRLAVLGVAASSLAVAYAGESAFSLLESSYELGLVSLLVPLLGGLYLPRSQAAALASMIVGTGTWLLHMGLGWETLLAVDAPLPMGLGCAAIAATVYLLGPRATSPSGDGSPASEDRSDSADAQRS
ncbi:MAG: sodium:solute symporter family protein [Myxococcales bacterium]|nr:sodium:solute symporter family protein [Myxococcales bacterium]